MGKGSLQVNPNSILDEDILIEALVNAVVAEIKGVKMRYKMDLGFQKKQVGSFQMEEL